MNIGFEKYFKDGNFQLTKELVESIPTLSTNSFATYAVNKKGIPI